MSKVDPITREIIKNALTSIADVMAWTVVRTARSAVVRDGMDFSTALFTPDGQQVAQGLTLPAHLGSMVAAFEGISRTFDLDEAGNGDVFLVNDPYQGGSHLPDIFLFKPIFCEDRRIGWACAVAHQTDMGGRAAGGIGCDSTDLFQEGLVLPPLKLYERGRRNDAVWSIIGRNVRVPDKVLGDINAQLSAVNSADNELRRLAGELGEAKLLEYMHDILETTERQTRVAIRGLPDGVWTFTDYLDDDAFDPNPQKIVVTITKHGETFHADFEGTARQVKGSINPNFAYTRTQVFTVMKCILGDEIPSNSGFYKCFSVSAPLGSLVNPVRPAAVGGRGLTGLRVCQVLFGAMAQALPGRIPAAWGGGELGLIFSGYHADHSPWLHVDILTDGPRGGGPDADGADGLACPVNNMSLMPIESIETEQPLRIEQFSFIRDSGGAGKYRGGLGMVRDFRLLAEEAIFQLRSDRVKIAPWGLEGGGPGSLTLTILNPDAEHRALPGKTMLTLKKNDVVRVIQAGAGGFGNPFERDPTLVADDVRQEKMSLEHALLRYGVVMDEATLEVDLAGTVEMRRHRLARMPA